MLIGKNLEQAINQQIGNELGASLQYLAIASYFDRQNLRLLGKLFFEQAEEEKEHAMKFVHYMNDTGADLRIPTVQAPKHDFQTAEQAVEAALNWEMEVTGQINNLMRIAIDESDYMAQSFLKWYIDEQLEEITKMEQLLSVVRRAGEKNLLTVEAYLVHVSKED